MANFAELGIKIDSDQAKVAADNLDSLAESGKKAEESTKRLAKSSADWAKEQDKINARAREMESQDSRRAASARKVNSALQEQQRELAKLLGSIDPTVAALGRLDEQERKLGQFRKQGLIDTAGFEQYNAKLQQQRNILGGVADAQGKAGMSARAYSAAMRGVPAQITDITTSLISGQPAYLVAIQQGGQLKDMFGGIGPAARALTTSLLGMINPLSLAAAGVAALAIAWKQGGDEATEFNKALILTGNYAGTTSEKLAMLAMSMDQIGGVTTRSAAKALAEVASTGAFTAEQVSLVGEAAERMRVATGKSIAETVAEFKKLKGDPVSAILELNESYHFLDKSQLENIKTLVAQGKAQEAVTQAFQIHADQLNQKSGDVVENLGAIERGWRGIKAAAAEAWDFMLDVGRDNTPAREIALLESQINSLKASGGIRGIVTESAQNEIDRLNEKISTIREQMSKPAPKVLMAGIYSEASLAQEKANEAWRQRELSLNKEARMSAEIAKIEAEGLAAGKSRAEIENAISLYKAQQADSAKKVKQSGVNADEKSARTLIETAQRQIVANERLATSGEKVTASQRLIIQIEQRLADTRNKMDAATRRDLINARDRLKASDDEAQATQQLTRDLAANAAMREKLAGITDQQRQANEAALLSIGVGGDAAEMLRRQLDIRRTYFAEVDRLEKQQRNESTRLSSGAYAEQKKMLEDNLNERLEIERQYQQQRLAMQGDWRNGMSRAYGDYITETANIAKQTESLFANAFSGAEDALVSFITTGKFSFTDFANSIIKDLARIAAKQMVTGLLGNIFSALGRNATTTMGNSLVSSGTKSINKQLMSGLLGRGTWSSGGYTGPGGVYQPAGIVHKGEVVWSQADVRAVGGPAAANSMRPTAGYARGGAVGVSVGPMAQPSINIQVENKGQPVSATASASRQPDGSMLIKMVLDAVADNMASGGQVAQAAQSRFDIPVRV